MYLLLSNVLPDIPDYRHPRRLRDGVIAQGIYWTEWEALEAADRIIDAAPKWVTLGEDQIKSHVDGYEGNKLWAKVEKTSVQYGDGQSWGNGNGGDHELRASRREDSQADDGSENNDPSDDGSGRKQLKRKKPGSKPGGSKLGAENGMLKKGTHSRNDGNKKDDARNRPVSAAVESNRLDNVMTDIKGWADRYPKRARFAAQLTMSGGLNTTQITWSPEASEVEAEVGLPSLHASDLDFLPDSEEGSVHQLSERAGEPSGEELNERKDGEDDEEALGELNLHGLIAAD